MTPWEETPYSLVSWWEMEKFSAALFFALGRYLCTIKRNVQKVIESEGNSRATTVGAGKTSPSEGLVSIRVECEKLGLTVSKKSVSHIIDLGTKERISLGELMDAIAELENTITWEMEDRLFAYIPPERAVRYDQKELFGQEVNAKFPNIQFDLVEAGNCYATGRGTAVVFHLMRIMETGVQSFGTKLGVQLADEKNWQNILDEINKRIKALPPKDAETIKMSQAAANLYAVKLAWRNEVMHPKDTYTLEEADNLIRQTKIFMEQLATIV